MCSLFALCARPRHLLLALVARLQHLALKFPAFPLILEKTCGGGSIIIISIFF